MIIRAFYGLRMGWIHRHRLMPYRNDPTLQIETILDLKPELLKAEGIKVLAIDFDGVLASHGEESLEQNIVRWLKEGRDVFGTNNIFILTNKPTHHRTEMFAAHGIQLIQTKRKKPYPDGIQQILSQTGITPSELMLIDDRLLTGILAAKIVGVQAKWVTKPFINLSKRPLTESFFIVLRGLERQLLRTQKKRIKNKRKGNQKGNQK